MKRFKVVKGPTPNWINIKIRTSNPVDVGKRIMSRLDVTEGVYHASTDGGNKYRINALVGELYSNAEMMPKIEKAVAAAFRPTILEITNTASINEFILWMSTATMVGYLMSLLV